MIWMLSLRNYDQPLINWWIWLQNVDVGQKSWSLTVCWPQLTFYPIQLIFSHLSNWLSKFVMQDLKLGMSIFGGLWWTMKFIWGIRNPIFLVKIKTLILWSQCLWGEFVWSTHENPLAFEIFYDKCIQKREGKIWGTIGCC